MTFLRLAVRWTLAAIAGFGMTAGCFGAGSGSSPSTDSSASIRSGAAATGAVTAGTSSASSQGASSASGSGSPSGASSTSSGSQPGLLGPYTTSGNKILDKNGNEHFFRGLDVSGLESSCTASIQLNEYSVMASWGANVVRVPLNQDCWLNDPSNPSYEASYAATVDDQVQTAQAQGMDIILDLHWSDQGSYSVGANCLTAHTNCQQIMADAHSVTFWQQVATTYANAPNVIFELYNEPHVGNGNDSPAAWSTWLDGGASGGSSSYPVVGMQQLYDAVRGAPASANNLVIIGGLNWAYDLAEVPNNAVQGTNIVYNTHPYSSKTPNPGPAAWQSAFGFLTATYPVIATEFGYLPSTQTLMTTEGPTDCNSAFDTMFTQYANQQGAGPTPSHMMSWSAWAFYFAGGDECNFPSLIYDSNYDPNAAGTVVQSALMAGP